MTAASKAADRVQLDHFPPQPSLQPFVTVISTLRFAEPRTADALPASVGSIGFMLSGKAAIRFIDGRAQQVPPVVLMAPTNAAVSLEIEGPLLMLAASLSPLGWAAITGLHAGDHADQAFDAAAVLGPDYAKFGDQLRDQHRAGTLDSAGLANSVAEFLGARCGPVNPGHARLIGQVRDWLSASFDPALAALEADTGLSARQLQRLIQRYYGAPPKQLARKYRALRVAALLQAPETGEERIAELLNLFYDQSHMIRELRRFVGRSPGRLGDDQAPMLANVTALRNYQEFRPNVAAIPKD